MCLGILQDYKTYLDFVLALENRRAPQSLQYFMRLLDINHKGHLNAFDLNYFFRVSTAYQIYSIWMEVYAILMCFQRN